MAPPSSLIKEGCLFSHAWRFRVCTPNQYLVKTGVGVPGGFMYARTTYQWPYQTVTFVPLNPRNLHFHLECMSTEMVPFQLPVVFTVAPFDPDVDSGGFERYAKKMATLSDAAIEAIVSGIVHGETRVLTATLTITELFRDRDAFKARVSERVCKDLCVLGLDLLNINVEEMRDLGADNMYFETLKRKALETASTDARVQVAQARMLGDIGEAERQAAATKRLAGLQAEVALERNLRQQDVLRSEAALRMVELECVQATACRKADADVAPRQRALELDTVCNAKRALERKAALQATDVIAAKAAAEVVAERALGDAQALHTRADAERYAQEQHADAKLAAATRQARGVVLLADAHATGLQSLLAVADREVVKFHMALEARLFETMAASASEAVRGMAPKINVWTTPAGTGAGDAGGASGWVPPPGAPYAPAGGGPFGPVSNILAALPPMLDALASRVNVHVPGAGSTA